MISIVRMGSIPKSVAIIMDGNRRYAVKAKKEKHEGHVLGLNKLEESLVWCKHLGIRELTVFALSKDNLKRPQKEVDTLMGLCKNQFARLCDSKGLFMREKMKVRVLGDLSVLPEDVAASLKKMETLTQNHQSGVLNVCICYDAKHEVLSAINKAALSKDDK
mmetsp:Transcript_4453/g.5795  ORF Transcript_4453/g.5795 Transcript_4453/m.5795 type:complete len:162 (+) Transcript_4453:137-622(+)